MSVETYAVSYYSMRYALKNSTHLEYIATRTISTEASVIKARISQ